MVTLSGAGPTHQWLMNDVDPASNIVDSGTGSTIDLDANSGVTTIAGIPGFGSATAVQFDGSDYTSNTTDASDLNGAAGSLAMWINSDSVATQQYLFIAVNNPVNSARWRVILQTDGKIGFTVNDSNTANTASGLITADAGWQLVVMTWDGTTQTVSVNAGARGTNEFSGSTSAIADIFIGSDQTLGSNFKGQMDAVYWFDYALTGADEVALYALSTDLPTLTQNPGHQWLMDSSSTCLDTPSGVSALDLTVEVGSVEAGTNALFTNSNQFDVNDGFKTSGVVGGLVGTFAWSFSAWIYPKQDEGASAIANQWHNGVSQMFDIYTIGQGAASGKMKLQYRTSKLPNSGTVAISGANEYNINQWHLVTWGYDPAASGAEMFLYVDGVSEGTAAQSGVLSANQTFVIGNQFDGGDGFEGEIDAVYHNSSALTLTDNINWYNSGNQTFEDFTKLAAPTQENLVPASYTDSGAQTIGEVQETLDNNVLKLTHPDGYDFYVKDGAAGSEGLSKAATHVKTADVYFDNASGTGTKYAVSNTALNTLLRLSGDHDLKVYEVDGSEEIKTGMYIKKSDGTYKLVGKIKVKSIIEVNQSITFPLTLPLIAP